MFNIKNLHSVFLIGQEPGLWNLFGAKKNSIINRINNGEDLIPYEHHATRQDGIGGIRGSTSLSAVYQGEGEPKGEKKGTSCHASLPRQTLLFHRNR